MKKAILSVDTGIDDAMAIAYTLGSKEMELIGIVGTYGNVNVKQGVKNDLNLLQMLGKKDIPVFEGYNHAIDKDDFNVSEVSADIHGQNGIGNVIIPDSDQTVESEDGIQFLIDSVKKYGKDLTIIATGPMTDLARVIKKYPKFKDEVGQIVIMGGALTVTGNVSKYAEANIHQDPQAAKILFESGAPITMVGLDVTMRTPINLSDTQKWRDTNTFAGKKYADIVDYYIHIYDKYSPYLHGGSLHDPSATCAAVHPEWFKMLSLYMTVDTQGETKGRTIGVMEKLREKKPNVKVCIDVDAEKVRDDICKTISNLFK